MDATSIFNDVKVSARIRSQRSATKVQCLLKNCTARSCFFAAASDENVPRFFLFPVFASFLREYKRNSPDFSLRIISTSKMRGPRGGLAQATPRYPNTTPRDRSSGFVPASARRRARSFLCVGCSRRLDHGRSCRGRNNAILDGQSKDHSRLIQATWQMTR